MTPEDAVPLMARWIAELQTDIADCQQLLADRERRVWVLERHIRESTNARTEWARDFAEAIK